MLRSQDVALVSSVPAQLTGAGESDALPESALGFLLRHVYLGIRYQVPGIRIADTG
jgi:hypothetical protein